MAIKLPNPLSALDDRALLARFAERHDHGAFEYLVKRHGSLVLGVCRRAVRDAHLAEDAFQAVFLVLARDPQRASSAASVGGWLFGIARRVALAARRRETRRERRESLRTSEPVTAPQSNFAELLDVLDEELGALPDECRAALVACFLEERTQDEAARELGWSLSTLRRRLERGKELLRARLAGRGITLGAGLLGLGVAAPARAAVPPLAAEPSPLSATLAAEVTRTGFGAKALGACAALLLATAGAAFAFAPADPVPEAPPAIPAPRVVDVPKWVAVSGRVVFPKDKQPPAAEYVKPGAMKDEEAMRPFAPLRVDPTLVDAQNRGMANVFVWLRPDSEDRKAVLPESAIHPNLREPKPLTHEVQFVAGQFSPRTTAVRFGDRVTFKNEMKVATNVRFDLFGGDAAFNLLVRPESGHTSKPLTDASSAWYFESNIHHWARGVVRGFDHPYFALTDGNGRFEIKNAPVGKWRLVMWHEHAGWRGGAPGKFGAKVTFPPTRDGTVALGAFEYDSPRWSEK